MNKELFFKHACVDQLAHPSSPLSVPSESSSFSLCKSDNSSTCDRTVVAGGSTAAEHGVNVFSSFSSSVPSSYTSSVQLTPERLQVLLGSLLMEPFMDSSTGKDTLSLFNSQKEAAKLAAGQPPGCLD